MNNPGFKAFGKWMKGPDARNYVQNKDQAKLNNLTGANKPNPNNRRSFSKNPRNTSKFYKSKNFSKKSPNAQEDFNIYFQIISREHIEIGFKGLLPPGNVLGVLRENGVTFNKQTNSYQVSISNYTKVYKVLAEMKGVKCFPIPELPLSIINSNDFPSSLTFFCKDCNSKGAGIKTTISYTDTKNYAFTSLPRNLQITLYKFQKEGIEFGIRKKGRLLIADEMGVGKTIQAICISAVFKDDYPCLIICPSSLKLAWKGEIEKWLTEVIDTNLVQVFKTGKEDFIEDQKFYIISYELAAKISEKIEKMEFKMAIVDEAHYLKNKDSKRTKKLTPILQKSKRLMLLTGTPILAKPVEIYPILHILRPDVFRSTLAFYNRYCDPKPTHFGMDYSGASNTRELNFMLQKVMIRRLKKDVLSQLPPKKRQKIEISTDSTIIKKVQVILAKSSKKFAKLIGTEIDFSEQRKDLREILGEDFSEVFGEEEAKQEEQQETVLSSFNKAYLLTGESKVQGIRDYVTYLVDNNCKFLIFAHHLKVLDEIEEQMNELKKGYMRIDGSVSTENRDLRIKQFQSDESCLVAILAITACNTGLTLTKASTVVFAELHMTPAVMIQAEDRAHRIGQEKSCVNIHYLYAKNTLDEMIFSKLNEKYKIVTDALDNNKKGLGVEKISEQVGEFVKINGKIQSIDERKLLTKGHNCCILDDFIKSKGDVPNNNHTAVANQNGFKLEVKSLNIHENNSKRRRTDFDEDSESEEEKKENKNGNKNVSKIFTNVECSSKDEKSDYNPDTEDQTIENPLAKKNYSKADLDKIEQIMKEEFNSEDEEGKEDKESFFNEPQIK